MSGLSRKIFSVCAATSVAIVGAGFGAPLAFSQQSYSTQIPVPSNSIDPDHNVKLNIYKYAGDPVNDTYVDQAPEGLDTIEGVDFRIQKVSNVDLTTQAGWETASKAIKDNNLDGLELDGDGTVVTTGANGLAEFSNDGPGAVGLYLVTELAHGDYTVAAPFLVPLPFPDEDEEGGWSYERNVYPKNQEVTPEKFVHDEEATVGEKLEYRVKAPVPAGNLTKFSIKDELDPDKLDLTEDSITIHLDDEELPELVADEHYDLTITGQTFEVVFNEAGRNLLSEQRKDNPGLAVHVDYEAVVVAYTDDGVITNTAVIEVPGRTITTDVDETEVPGPGGPEGPEGPEGPGGPGEPGRPTSVTFGTLNIIKTATEPGDLSGATFELYRCVQENGEWQLQGNARKVGTSNDADSQPTSQLVTQDTDPDDQQATYTGFGVPVSKFDSHGQVDHNYCLIETKAPEGYVLNPEVIPVEKSQDDETGAWTLSATVHNTRENFISQLPATGAWGVALAFLLGLGLLARGLYTSRKDSQAIA